MGPSALRRGALDRRLGWVVACRARGRLYRALVRRAGGQDHRQGDGRQKCGEDMCVELRGVDGASGGHRSRYVRYTR